MVTSRFYQTIVWPRLRIFGIHNHLQYVKIAPNVLKGTLLEGAHHVWGIIPNDHVNLVMKWVVLIDLSKQYVKNVIGIMATVEWETAQYNELLFESLVNIVQCKRYERVLWGAGPDVRCQRCPIDNTLTHDLKWNMWRAAGLIKGLHFYKWYGALTLNNFWSY